MNDLEHNRDHGDESTFYDLYPGRVVDSHGADVAVEHAHAVRGPEDPDCICGGGFTVHEHNAGGHNTSCPLWGQTWDGWQS